MTQSKTTNTNTTPTHMTAKQLAEWILTLPEEIQQGAVTSIVYGDPFSAKRAVAAFVNGRPLIYVESMGTHIETPLNFELVSYITHGGRVMNAEEAALQRAAMKEGK